MFVQPENLLSSSSDSSKLTLAKPKDLKNITTEQHHVEPYKTIKRGAPAVRPEVDISLKNTKDKRLRGMIHSLARLDASGHCLPPETQQVGAFTGFQSCIHKCVVQSKAYYFLTFPKPPHKSVVHQVMCKMIKAAETNMMPFIQLVGDQPVYTLIVQLKNENPQIFGPILPFLGPFHTHMSFISAIKKRFKGSGIAEILVAADVIADGSVDQALSGKHYKRSTRCLKLMYEVLTRRIISTRIE